MSDEPKVFGPELDAIFDDAQNAGVAVDFDGRSFVLLSQKSFDTVLAGTNMSAEVVKHVPVRRVGKPITYILSRAAFDELVKIHENLLSLISSSARIGAPI